MSLNADTLIDRSYLKGQITKWRAIAILVIVLSAILITSRFDNEIIVSEYVARVKIEGIITDDIRRDKLFTTLEKDDNVKAVLLWVDSPGGTVVGGEQLYLNVGKLAKKKPVVVVMRSLATSAGYMATLQASKIYARHGTITGSIGVIMQSAEFTELAERMGIEPITIKSGPNKAAPNPLEKITPENRAVMELVVADFYDTFVTMVSEGRGMDRRRVMQLADGRIFTGPQALQLGLIDELGGEDDAIDWLKAEYSLSDDIAIRNREPEREKPKTIAELFSQMAKSIVIFPQIQLDGLVSIWQPKSM
ncbi:MAG: signal peptide peptidase SppA [Alphaproteobacteria bacterium]|nr:signal peptide peptidase SppA [Alphaproteobacteria bacterium]